MFLNFLQLLLIIEAAISSSCGAHLRSHDIPISSPKTEDRKTEPKIHTHIFRESIPQLSSRNDILSRVRAEPVYIHEVVFVIVQRNIDLLTRVLYDLSDPISPNYGRHWTRERIADLTSNPEAHSAVVLYLLESGASIMSSTISGEYVTASAPVALWERIFNTKFFIFYQSHSDGRVERLVRAEKYWIPRELDAHVESVFRTIEMPVISSGSLSILPSSTVSSSPLSKSGSASTTVVESESEVRPKLVTKADLSSSTESRRHPHNKMKTSALPESVITPAKIRSYYNMSSGVKGSPGSTQAVFASVKQYMSPADLKFFLLDQGLPSQQIAADIGNYVSNSVCLSQPNSCAEGNLDTQYIISTSIASPTTYWYTDFSFSDWLVTVANTPSPPLVFSISYGQDELSTSASELSAFSTQAIKLGAMGVTILVASGDDGANSRSVRTSGTLACGYSPDYPATSPFVTAVGATSVRRAASRSISSNFIILESRSV